MTKETIDYLFVDDPSNDTDYALKLISGQYSNLIYKYENIRLNEDEANNVCRLSFVYKIIYKPKKLDKIDLDTDDVFKNHIGDVLNDILSNQEFKMGNHG
jgi:hypothetical protein